MNTELRKEAKKIFEKYFFKLMNNSVFGKTMENVRNHGDIKIVTTNRRRSNLVSETNYHTTKHISELNKLYLLIVLWENFLRNKHKQLKIKEKSIKNQFKIKGMLKQFKNMIMMMKILN